MIPEDFYLKTDNINKLQNIIESRSQNILNPSNEKEGTPSPYRNNHL